MTKAEDDFCLLLLRLEQCGASLRRASIPYVQDRLTLEELGAIVSEYEKVANAVAAALAKPRKQPSA